MKNLDMDSIHPRFPYYNKKVEPISLRDWAKHREDASYSVLAYTRVRSFHVSTMWMGLDMEILTDVPIIFETAILGRCTVIRRRYATERQAMIGHGETCRMIHSGWRPHSATSRRREATFMARFQAWATEAATEE